MGRGSKDTPGTSKPTTLRTYKKAALKKLYENPLLQKCDKSLPPIGTLVCAREHGSIYWPACIAINPSPDEDEVIEAQEEADMNNYAFLMYIEPQFRLGLVSWSNVILVDLEKAEEQMTMILKLNQLERSKIASKQLKRFKEAWEMMREYFVVEASERQQRMQTKWKELNEVQKQKNLESRKKSTSVKLEPPPSLTLEKPKEPSQRMSNAYRFRPNVTVPKKWDYAEVTAEPSRDSSESSETGSTSSKKITKFSRPSNLDGDALKAWTLEKFDKMDKQLKFDSKDYVVCSKCEGELRDADEYIYCHDYPFHKTCLKEIKLTRENEIILKYKCEDCFELRCFICKKPNGVDEAPPKCSKCDLRFHRDCLIFKWPQSDVIGSNGIIICPLHFCHVCKAEHFHFDKVRNYRLPNSKAMKCILCLAAYHKGSCIPAGTGNSIMQNQFLICPRHKVAEAPVAKKKKLGCFTCQKKLSLKDDIVPCTLCPLTFHASCVHGEYHVKAGISLDEFSETFKCEGCLWGTFPLYGQVVWYQQPGSIYWPSMILYPRDATNRGVKESGQFSVSYCGSPIQFWDNGRSSNSVPLEIGNKDFLKKLNMYSNHKVAAAAKEAFHLIKLSEGYRDISLPAPEPYYKKIEKNLYRVPISFVTIKNKSNGKRSNVKQKGSSDDDEICLCGKSPGDDPVCTPGSGCFNRDAAIECNNVNCSGNERCGNRMFSSKKTGQVEDFLEYFVSSSTKGWGLRTKCGFPEGAFLSEYLGEIISKEEVMWRVERKCDDDPLYFLEISTTTFIDAEYYGNMSRLINHSCDPNCRIEKYYSAHGKSVVGIFAKRAIEKGEELTFDYNYGPKSTFAFKCRCKSEDCKGFIGRRSGNEENLIPNGKPATRMNDDSDWKWEDECATCGTRGELLMCDFIGCCKAFHLQCLGIISTPKGEWYCPHHDPDFEEKLQEHEPNNEPPPLKKSKLSTRV